MGLEPKPDGLTAGHASHPQVVPLMPGHDAGSLKQPSINSSHKTITPSYSSKKVKEPVWALLQTLALHWILSWNVAF